ncbi:ABC-2 transporter permease [Eubacterium sp. 1001713B170207_170306_E7]|uniref:ABC-2 transporter permease n=1 Tax=Eubacterium sp. 1001713B170207_170306_E7 TaxID=2787097 RepID=UPI0018996969|nr:ABC-2 transporter permease [Eubacterium sp. 1001713B170207_170306_E7]
MKGLIIKEFLAMRRYLKLIAILLALYIVMAFLTRSASFFSAVNALLVVFCAFNSFSYDRYNHWNEFAVSLPVSRREMVRSKYVFLLLLALAFTLILLVVNVILNVSADNGLSAVIRNALASVSFALIYLSITTPLIYKFDLEKARYVMIVCAFVPFLLSYIVSSLAGNSIVVLPRKESLISMSVYMTPILTVVFFIGSYLISKLIFLKKDL